MPASLPIGALARQAQTTLRTIRWYVELGLLSPMDNASGARAQFEPSALSTIRTITAMKEAGFSLAEIKGILDAIRSGDTKQKRLTISLREVVLRQRRVIHEKELALRAVRESLDVIVGSTDRCDACGSQGPDRDCAGCGNLTLLKSLGISEQAASAQP